MIGKYILYRDLSLTLAILVAFPHVRTPNRCGCTNAKELGGETKGAVINLYDRIGEAGVLKVIATHAAIQRDAF